MIAIRSDDGGPPKATLSRRAQSYTDFHHAAKNILAKDRGLEKRKGPKGHEAIANDLEFAEWYDSLEKDLLDASHEEYTYVGFPHMIVGAGLTAHSVQGLPNTARSYFRTSELIALGYL